VKMYMGWSPQTYESLWFPIGNYFAFGRKRPVWNKEKGRTDHVRIWRFDLWGFLFDPWSGILRSGGWDLHCSPSYGQSLVNLWNNVCIFCTPWYRTRRRLLQNLVNLSDTKLLRSDRRSADMRTRTRDQVYLYVEFGLVFGKVTAVRYLNPKGESVNLFMGGLEHLTMTDLEPLKEERRLVTVGPVLTMRQCQEFLDRAVAATKPWLSWYDPSARDEG